MATTSGTYSRSSSGFSTPEDGIAEWATKIKAMQQQVDADEEAEQKKLEEEIAASRLARQRRSRGVGPGSRVHSLDLSAESSKLAAIKDLNPVSPDVHISSSERQAGQEAALKRLAGDPHSPISPLSRSSASASSAKPEAISLAAFMGGRANGPRLNRHAPQQDAHDPTQFEQRTRIDAPHPIFGSRGIAMPGMTSQPKSLPALYPNNTNHNAEKIANPDDMRARRLSTPSSAASRYAEPSQPRAMSPQKTDNRERTISTPSGAGEIHSSSSSSRPFTTATYMTTTAISTPIESSAKSPSSPPPYRIFTPSLDRAKTPSTTSLARPMQPAPRSSLGSIPPLFSNPSPAFLKPPAQKDPTPSISRLQGRGFVQNMVKASQGIQSPAQPTIKEEPIKSSGVRKASVLDRWQPQAENMTSRSPPSGLPKANPMRKARTTAPSSPPADGSRRQSLKSVPSLPSMRTTKSPSPTRSRASNGGSPGLGSATTMMIIKPPPPPEPQISFPGVDELGVHRTGGGKVTFADMSPEPRKPLAHPTKARAKKPRKSSKSADSGVSISGNTDSVSPVSSPTQPKVEEVVRPADSSPTVVASSLSEDSQEKRTPPPSSKVSHITDRWGPNGIIQSGSPATHSTADPSPKPTAKMTGGQALPEMTESEGQSLVRPKSKSDLLQPAPRLPSIFTGPSSDSPDIHSPRHTRIPSSGNRPTVMDVAQAFQSEAKKTPEPDRSPPSPALDAIASPVSVVSPRQSFTQAQLAHSFGEKRRSSYDRFSGIALPPLKEEVSPAPSPGGTLSCDVATSLTLRGDPAMQEKAVVAEPGTITFVFKDEVLPTVDISPLLSGGSVYVPDSTIRDISVDVMTVIGSSTTVLSSDINTFYDSDVVAIIHRKKSIASGLVATTVWGWHGKNSSLEDSEERKLAELASRYGTSVIHVLQYAEPPDMFFALGGEIIIRQGDRSHWAPENTAMHVARFRNGFVALDELDLNIKNLCSAFSYCVSVLGTVYVWHGCGSLPNERKSAQAYARKLGENVIELADGASEDDADMFWMVLGEEEYARADYWRWRREATRTDPSAWQVDASKGPKALSHVLSLADHPSFDSSVFLLDCIWEVFVIVGKNARGKRNDIKLAIEAAQALTSAVSTERPYAPTVHVVVLPSQVPLDLKLHFRDLEGVLPSSEDTPDHMNLLSISDALYQLQQTTWAKTLLSDTTMLPLGISPSDL